MDIKTKIEDEIILVNDAQSGSRVESLNKKGIFTIEDFINSDSDQLAKDTKMRRQYRGFQDILKYKYLGQPLATDAILTEEYISSEAVYQKLEARMQRLGFGNSNYRNAAVKIIKAKGSCKTIDIIKSMSNRFAILRDFYIEYYNTHIKNDEVVVQNDKHSLEALKDELISLLNQRKELDAKISSLSEKINSLDGGKNY